MKKNGNQLARLKSVIETDRLCVSGNFEELVTTDLSKLLKDYFDMKTKPELCLKKEGNTYAVEINFIATRVKTFGAIPRE